MGRAAGDSAEFSHRRTVEGSVRAVRCGKPLADNNHVLTGLHLRADGEVRCGEPLADNSHVLTGLLLRADGELRCGEPLADNSHCRRRRRYEAELPVVRGRR